MRYALVGRCLLFFIVSHHVGHLDGQHAGHHVGHDISHHVGHRNVVSTLCEVSETLTEWKSETITDGGLTKTKHKSSSFIK